MDLPPFPRSPAPPSRHYVVLPRPPNASSTRSRAAGYSQNAPPTRSRAAGSSHARKTRPVRHHAHPRAARLHSTGVWSHELLRASIRLQGIHFSVMRSSEIPQERMEIM
eukprot:CAMPEP_0180545962 /NCGR_PEP_ID=MMETSP1036_2-20121128/70314_1 /TAXON_ID=632150 /ORGANISM="Azadinium spinosum, Strain 3D9" /LENGTH=108 /DNA_ID=CAMNT_0022561029 /DNA_START=437 /DNA_END=760 /DNA_ORIENTATION=+